MKICCPCNREYTIDNPYMCKGCHEAEVKYLEAQVACAIQTLMCYSDQYETAEEWREAFRHEAKETE